MNISKYGVVGLCFFTSVVLSACSGEPRQSASDYAKIKTEAYNELQTKQNETAQDAYEPTRVNLSANHPNTLPAPKLDSLGQSTQDEQIRRGLLLVSSTYRKLPDHVGNKLNCTSCHLNQGKVANAAPFIGVNVIYPKYRSRNARINTIEDRINGCFERSMNGKALAVDSPDMKAIVAYMNWLSQGVQHKDDLKGNGFIKIDRQLVPDANNGERIFKAKCVSCHQSDGGGLYPDGEYMYPAIAGKDSFNDGAGMARTYKAAAFIKTNMPLGEEGTLTAQEAVDVAKYIAYLDRPVFPNKAGDWPKGGAPTDVRR